MQDSQKNRLNHYSETRDEGAYRRHDVNMANREKAMITGVSEVISFDSNEILLETTQGTLAFRGENLHVRRLTLEKGEVDIDGTIDELKYSDLHSVKDARSFLGRLFQ